MQSRIIIISILCLSITGSIAQSNKFVIWNSLQFPILLSNKWQIQNDLSYRTLGFSTRAYQYTFRTGLRYNIRNNFSITAGIADFNTRTVFKKQISEFAREFRTWQEISLDAKALPSIQLLNRVRLEERHFYRNSIKNSYDALRIRYRIGLQKKISDTYSILISNEYMGQIENKEYGFQQNRLGFSILYSFSPNMRIQTGYIWSKLTTDNFHYAIITFQKTFDFNGQDD